MVHISDPVLLFLCFCDVFEIASRYKHRVFIGGGGEEFARIHLHCCDQKLVCSFLSCWVLSGVMEMPAAPCNLMKSQFI